MSTPSSPTCPARLPTRCDDAWCARCALHKAFPTLRDPSEGRLLGEGDPSAIVVDSAMPGRAGVLALHGFAGTPLEVQLVTDVAKRTSSCSARSSARGAWP